MECCVVKTLEIALNDPDILNSSLARLRKRQKLEEAEGCGCEWGWALCLSHDNQFNS